MSHRLKSVQIETARGRFNLRDGGGDGWPVVMLHGWPEDGYCWQPVARHLAPRWRILAPDLLGLGDSERAPERGRYRKQALAQDMLTLLDRIGVGRCHLVGHDWGGVVAQEMALAHPERIATLVLINIVIINNLRSNLAASRKQSGTFATWYQHFQQTDLPGKLIPGNEEAWLGYFLRAWGGEVPTDAFDEYVRMYRIPGTPETGANYYRAMRRDVERWATLGRQRFPMPALYIYGNRDPVITPDYLEDHQSCFEQVRLVELDAGHFVPEEQPERVAAEIGAFFDEQPPAENPS